MHLIRHFQRSLALRSRVLLLGSKAEAEEAEQNLEIAFRLLIDTERWVWGSLEGSPGGDPSGSSPLECSLRVRSA